MTDEVLVIYNPSLKAEVHAEEWVGQLVAELGRSNQYIVSFYPTNPDTTPRDLVPYLVPPLKLVIAAGGDGTIRLALAALAMAKSPIPAALFPVGTGNVLARNLGIVDQDIFLANPLAHVYDYIANGIPMRIDMGMMNGEYFAGMAGVGPISDAFMLPEREEKTSGKLITYMKSLLTSIAIPPRIFKITTGGHTFKVQASAVIISNVEDLGIGKESKIEKLCDGVLNLHVINPLKVGDYIALTKRYGAGSTADNPCDSVIEVKEAVVETVPRLGVQSKFQQLFRKILNFIRKKPLPAPRRVPELPCMIDGDAHSVTPMRVTVIPEAVTILVPPDKRLSTKPVLRLSSKDDEPESLPLPKASGL